MGMSYSSTPARDISIPPGHDEGIHLVEPSEEHSLLPQYLKGNFFVALDDSLEPGPNLMAGDSYSVSPVDYDDPADTSTPGTPELREFHERAEDDSAINAQPWRNVDYLSHDWKDEDIWSSWKYITSCRGESPKSARLENASWRTWTKYKNNLKTVSPETLNWLKGDVNWLYGPLQPGASKIYCTQTGPSSASLFQSNSLVNINRKPILKKRSMSDIILQRPLSSSSSLLPQQATEVAQAREKDSRWLTKPSFDRAATTDHSMFPFSSTSMSRDTSSMLPSSASSGISSPSVERKHIHFNDKVEQCIAVEVKGGDDDDHINTVTNPNGDSNSDDGIMMKLARPRKPDPLMRKKAKEGKNSLPSDGKMIAMLPSTTLKHREHILEVPETAILYSSSIFHSHLVSPFSPQEAARPPEVLGRFFGEEEEEDMMDADADSAWYGNSGSFEEPGLHRTTSTDSLAAEPAGMRRTPSGMFMPYEVVTSSNNGIFCCVIDTINTARDIAHVIWNMDWR